MDRKALPLAFLFVLLLAAGCGEVPTAAPGQEQPTPAAYPPPPTAPAPASTVEAPPTPKPTGTPLPTHTPTPTPDLAPQLVVQPVPEDLRAGERIAFLKDGDLWLVRPDGSGLTQVTLSGNVTALYGWSYDCAYMLLGVGERPGPPEAGVLGGRDLWVVPANGVGSVPLVQGLEVLEARWSPVDNRIAYGTRDGNIHLLNHDGTGYRLLLDNHSALLGAWSPSGEEIALQWMPAPLDYWTLNLAILHVQNGLMTVPIPVAPDRVDYRPYVWSVDGRQILFQSERGDSLWWRVELGEKNELRPLQGEQLHDLVTISAGVSRSPVADQVVFWNAGYDPDSPIIWVMDFDGSQLRKLTVGGNPAWSPDGKRVAYTDAQGGLGVVNLDGSGALQIVRPDRDPLWYEPCWCR